MHMEALLFALGRPLSRTELAKKLSVTPLEIEEALLFSKQQKRGIVFIDDGKGLELRTATEASGLIDTVRKDEYAREVGRAGIETLAAILYRGPLTRAEIDFIRGVNSSQILRTLTMRGLVRKIQNPKDERSFLYEPTADLLSFIGARDASEIPDFTSVKTKLTELEDAYHAREHTDTQDTDSEL